jgi:hypothetical protein
MSDNRFRPEIVKRIIELLQLGTTDALRPGSPGQAVR